MRKRKNPFIVPDGDGSDCPSLPDVGVRAAADEAYFVDADNLRGTFLFRTDEFLFVDDGNRMDVTIPLQAISAYVLEPLQNGFNVTFFCKGTPDRVRFCIYDSFSEWRILLHEYLPGRDASHGEIIEPQPDLPGEAPHILLETFEEHRRRKHPGT
ncbi:MAG: hypothetical protein VZR02_05615 [Lachnospiraceae bacterium]|nr:hypothetical protein [Lachnospiraceae bacterium]